MSTSATTTEAPSEISSRNCQTTSLCNVWLESQDSTTLSSRRPNFKPERWFTLYRRPNPNSATANFSMAPVRGIPNDRLELYKHAAVGPKIYLLSCKIGRKSSTKVWIFDCRFHKWERGPNMPTARKQGLRTIVLDAKIYAFGSLTSEGSWADMFDTVAGRWEAIPSPELTVYDKLVLGCGIRDGKVGVWVEGEELRFDPVSKTWEVFSLVMPEFSHICEVSGVLCCCDVYIKEFKGLDERVGLWKEIKLVNGGFPNDFMMLQTLNVGGRSVIVGLGRIGICCAEFEVKQDRDNGDFFGEVLWSDMVYSMHKSLLYRLSLFNTLLVLLRSDWKLNPQLTSDRDGVEPSFQDLQSDTFPLCYLAKPATSCAKVKRLFFLPRSLFFYICRSFLSALIEVEFEIELPLRELGKVWKEGFGAGERSLLTCTVTFKIHFSL
ncbi:hypothetical protein TIFTF001_004183 [Ficus carica]|uniref:FKB95-like N-terminal Kelch domain-containing protein n=1 Tax=Ficus carica TaxID=3494 RepID=A0AA87ZWW9_FICCA|nr:hypothetical protein TIFTF001_004183 [Ficus carica]